MRWLGPHPRRALATPAEARERLHRWHARERGLDSPLGYWAIVPLDPAPAAAGTAAAIAAAAATGRDHPAGYRSPTPAGQPA